MKLIMCIVMTAALAAVTVQGAAEEKDTAYRIRRGANNVMFGWLEIPRNIIYEDARIPYAGFFYGLVKGPLMTVWRGTAGLVDLVAFGQTGQGLYMNRIPDSPCDLVWFPDTSESTTAPAVKAKNMKPVKRVEKKNE